MRRAIPEVEKSPVWLRPSPTRSIGHHSPILCVTSEFTRPQCRVLQYNTLSSPSSPSIPELQYPCNFCCLREGWLALTDCYDTALGNVDARWGASGLFIERLGSCSLRCNTLCIRVRVCIVNHFRKHIYIIICWPIPVASLPSVGSY